MIKKFELLDEDKLRGKGYIKFAQVGRPHGLKGAFFLKTQDKRTAWDGYKTLLCETNEGFYEGNVLKHYLSGNALVIMLNGLDNRSSIESLYNKNLYVHKNQIQVHEDEYVVGSLIGYKVFAENKGLVGIIQGVSSYGAQDNLEILALQTNKVILFPFISTFVTQVNEREEKIDIIYVPEFFEDDGK